MMTSLPWNIQRLPWEPDSVSTSLPQLICPEATSSCRGLFSSEIEKTIIYTHTDNALTKATVHISICKRGKLLIIQKKLYNFLLWKSQHTHVEDNILDQLCLWGQSACCASLELLKGESQTQRNEKIGLQPLRSHMTVLKLLDLQKFFIKNADTTNHSFKAVHQYLLGSNL